MTNEQDALRNEEVFHLSNAELIKRVRGAVANECGLKQAQQWNVEKPIIEWDNLLKTKLISKPCFI